VIFVFGTICIDRLLRVPELPAPGGYVEITQELKLLGGEAANTATALTAWNSEVILAGNDLGSGPEGDFLRNVIAQKGVSLVQPMSVSGHTPVCDIYITPDGERTMFGQGFSTMVVPDRPETYPMQAGDWFTAEPNLGAIARVVVEMAVRKEMKIYLMDFIADGDPVPRGSFWQCSTDWVGFRNNMQRNVEWVKQFSTLHQCFVILSDGPNGFVAGGYAEGQGEFSVRHYPPFPAPIVVDTTGAGDMFRAGMLFGLAKGWDLPHCLQFASSAGCLKCRALGATSDVPLVQEIEAHILANPDVARRYE